MPTGKIAIAHWKNLKLDQPTIHLNIQKLSFYCQEIVIWMLPQYYLFSHCQRDWFEQCGYYQSLLVAVDLSRYEVYEGCYLIFASELLYCHYYEIIITQFLLEFILLFLRGILLVLFGKLIMSLFARISLFGSRYGDFYWSLPEACHVAFTTKEIAI